MILRKISIRILQRRNYRFFPCELKLEFINDVEIIIVDFEGKNKPYSAFGKC